MNENEAKLWFKNAKYGMMMHFGLYSVLEGEYKGKQCGNYAEWIQSKYQIPIKEMEEIAKEFDPKGFDADKIIKLAKDCGMQYFVITSKHHEGFALFNSEVDDFNSYKMSKCHRDFIKEISEACHKYEIKLGLYYSQDLDWHEEHGGGYLTDYLSINPNWIDGTTFDNSWDFKRGYKNYDICFRKKILPQVKELLTNYGEIATIWFDVPATINKEQSQELRDLVKSLQPNCLIDSRIGNDLYDYYAFEDNEVPPSLLESWTIQNQLKCGNRKPLEVGLYESACTLNKTWGFNKFDLKWKSPEQIYQIKKGLNAIGVNYLINVGPNKNGEIPQESIDILKRVKQYIDLEK